MEIWRIKVSQQWSLIGKNDKKQIFQILYIFTIFITTLNITIKIKIFTEPK